MLNRSEYTANLMIEKTREENQAEAHRRVRATITRYRQEKARKAGIKNWWQVK